MSKPLGVGLPFINPNTGTFNQTFDTLKTAKTNIYILLNTRKGERINEPDYYFDIDDLLFDNSNPDELQKIVDIELRAAIDTWVPTVSVLSVKYKNFNQTIENNQIEFDVVFALKNDLSKKETLNLTYNTQAS